MEEGVELGEERFTLASMLLEAFTLLKRSTEVSEANDSFH